MRQTDLKQLEQPFSEDDSRDPDEQITQALGVHLPSVSALSAEIRSDLDPQTYGVSWWKGYKGLGTQRRILISDQLLLCSNSIELNLREAKLHLLEASHYFDEKTREHVASIRFDWLDRPYWDKEPMKCAADHLAGELARVHIVGVVRAVASAFDCLAAAIIGVAAFDKSILRADFHDLLKNVLRSSTPPTTDGERLQKEIARSIVQAVDSAGPPGWLEWSLDYRNMLVHRGRHLEVSLVRAEGEVSVSPRRWQPFRLPIAVTLLPRDPGRAEVEVLRDMLGQSLLEETAETTLAGLLNAALQVIGKTCEVLKDGWRKRRQSPDLLIQPAKQWKKTEAPYSSVFRGFHPGERPDQVGDFAVSPLLIDRLRAAALSGGKMEDNITRWNEFD